MQFTIWQVINGLDKVKQKLIGILATFFFLLQVEFDNKNLISRLSEIILNWHSNDQ